MPVDTGTVVGLALAVMTLPVFFYVGACLCGTAVEWKEKQQSEGERRMVTGVAHTHTHARTHAHTHTPHNLPSCTQEEQSSPVMACMQAVVSASHRNMMPLQQQTSMTLQQPAATPL